jgi:hypothetical protein
LKSWRTRFALACGTISLLAFVSGAGAASSGKSAIVLVDPADLPQWQTWTAAMPGWQVIAPAIPSNSNIDQRVQALETAALEAVKNGSVDRSRIYLAGRGEAAAVFYTVSRLPDLWAAAVAVGGTPQAAIDAGRLYASNFSNVPVLWIGSDSGDQALAAKLTEAGLNLEWRNAEMISAETVFDWLAAHVRTEYPPSIDCETSSPSFSRCYWIRVTKFDAAEPNEVLPSSRIPPPIRPELDLGGFGFKTDDPGPGILISFLPEKYSGPLKIGDRIVALGGRSIADAQAYVELMSSIKEEKPATAMVQRGKERLRIETAVVLPKRAPPVSGRVQADFDPAQKEIRILSRTVAAMEVTVPPRWLPASLTWNGVPLEKLDSAPSEPRCLLLRIEQELETAGPCQ